MEETVSSVPSDWYLPLGLRRICRQMRGRGGKRSGATLTDDNEADGGIYGVNRWLSVGRHTRPNSMVVDIYTNNLYKVFNSIDFIWVVKNFYSQKQKYLHHGIVGSFVGGMVDKLVVTVIGQVINKSI